MDVFKDKRIFIKDRVDKTPYYHYAFTICYQHLMILAKLVVVIRP
jgi:hypothetical protein